MSPEERTAVITRLTETEVELFTQRHRRSYELCRVAVEASMPLGVPTNVCPLWPFPITIENGTGPYVVDADGHRMVDFSAGYGAMVCGQSHPDIVAAVQEQLQRGTHFGALTTPIVSWAQDLCHRFNLNWVRFSASGTEATMDAIRLARAHTGRPFVIKAEGAYHGSHLDALVSINQEADGSEGPDDNPNARPADESVPQSFIDHFVRVIPFNNLDAARRALADKQVAAVILEPIMFNVGFIWPQPDYLPGLRELCDETGTLLIFDEVKTGATISYGGAEESFGVRPDFKCFAKATTGGLPGGAFGATDAATYELIENWDMIHVGTLSGNPITAAAGHAALHTILHPDAYPQLIALNEYLRAGINDIIDRYQLPAYTTGVGAKGCIVWADPTDGQIVDFRDYQRRFDGRLATLVWLFMVNRDCWLAPGHDEQYTLSVAHTNEDLDTFIREFEELAKLLTSEGVLGDLAPDVNADTVADSAAAVGAANLTLP